MMTIRRWGVSRIGLVYIALCAAVLISVLGFFTPQRANAQGCGAGVTYVVQRGQTLFRIALRYGTNVSTLAAANGIANINRIYVGQVLNIPCASGVVGVPPVIGSPVTPVIIAPPTARPNIVSGVNPANVGVNCTGLRATSPLDGLANGDNTFYWDGAPGATGYRLNVYSIDGANGALVRSAETGPFANSVTINLGIGPAGQGFRFAYEIQALVSSIPVCSTPRITLFRASLPPAATATPIPPTVPAP